MNQAPRNIASPVLVGVLVLTAAFVPSYARWPAVPQHPPVMAVVDLERVFNEINLRTDKEAELRGLIVKLEEKQSKLQDEATQLKEDLELYANGTDQYDKAESKWKHKVIEYLAVVQFSRDKLDAGRERITT